MAWHCDWLAGRFPLKAARELNGGYLIHVNRQGEKEFTQVKRLAVEGSHESRVLVRSIGDDLEYSGNPCKFLFGHNVYGPPLTRFLFTLFAWSLACALGVEPDITEVLEWWAGDVPLTCVDVTRMYRPEGVAPGWEEKWIAIAAAHAHGGHQRVTNRGAYDAGTLYVGQHSRRIATKIYAKGAELRRHPAHPDTPQHLLDIINSHAQGSLRVEVRLRSMELKRRKLDRVSLWTPSAGDAILAERIAKLSLPEDLRMTEEEVTNLPRHLRLPYRAWQEGEDLRTLYSRRHFYRLRSELLKFDIDIAHVRPHEVVTERGYKMGRPLKDFLAGSGLEPPAADTEMRGICAI